MNRDQSAEIFVYICSYAITPKLENFMDTIVCLDQKI